MEHTAWLQSQPWGWLHQHWVPPKEANHPRGIQDKTTRGLRSSLISGEDCFTLQKRQSSERWLTCLPGLSQKDLTVCFCYKISPAPLCSWKWQIHEMNVCIFMMVSLESGWAGQPPWSGCWNDHILAQQEGCGTPNVLCWGKLLTWRKLLWDRDKNLCSQLTGFSSLTMQKSMSLREVLCSWRPLDDKKW